MRNFLRTYPSILIGKKCYYREGGFVKSLTVVQQTPFLNPENGFRKDWYSLKGEFIVKYPNGATAPIGVGKCIDKIHSFITIQEDRRSLVRV
jgi:hypothetical protein